MRRLTRTRRRRAPLSIAERRQRATAITVATVILIIAAFFTIIPAISERASAGRERDAARAAVSQPATVPAAAETALFRALGASDARVRTWIARSSSLVRVESLVAGPWRSMGRVQVRTWTLVAQGTPTYLSRELVRLDSTLAISLDRAYVVTDAPAAVTLAGYRMEYIDGDTARGVYSLNQYRARR